jgi:hypothetical protein
MRLNCPTLTLGCGAIRRVGPKQPGCIDQPRSMLKKLICQRLPFVSEDMAPARVTVSKKG